ncbi:MAG TPA: hypothetical protein QF564_18020 [Pirellulaceae bacterium]|jgi:hypothetical protein|nr:hypothetical protein [Pirellulaceae bacterium]
MLQKWRSHGVITHAGYILGFPADTPESIERDIRVLQNELPIDILEFFIMTPLPGSQDHQTLDARGVPMATDMNIFDLEHVTVDHPRMSQQAWQEIYERAWHLYYSPEHIETLLRRAEATGGPGARKMADSVLVYYGTYRFEHLHPLQSGILRRKVRATRRPSFPMANPLLHLPLRVLQTAATWLSIGLYYVRLHRVARRIRDDAQAKQYMDLALTPVRPSAEAEPEEVAATGKTAGVGPAITPLNDLLKKTASDRAPGIERVA